MNKENMILSEKIERVVVEDMSTGTIIATITHDMVDTMNENIIVHIKLKAD